MVSGKEYYTKFCILVTHEVAFLYMLISVHFSLHQFQIDGRFSRQFFSVLRYDTRCNFNT